MNFPHPQRISRAKIDRHADGFWLAWTEALVTIVLTLALIYGMAHAMGPLR